jgi:CRP-like cAMP-binding protein
MRKAANENDFGPTSEKRSRPFQVSPQVSVLLQSFGKVKKVESGRVLFRKGDAPMGTFLVLSGRVALSAGDDPVRITRIAEQGSLLGLPATIRQRPYSLTAEAVTDCEVCGISSERLRKALLEYPAIGLAIVEILAEEVSVLRTLAVYKV